MEFVSAPMAEHSYAESLKKFVGFHPHYELRARRNCRQQRRIKTASLCMKVVKGYFDCCKAMSILIPCISSDCDNAHSRHPLTHKRTKQEWYHARFPCLLTSVCASCTCDSRKCWSVTLAAQDGVLNTTPHSSHVDALHHDRK